MDISFSPHGKQFPVIAVSLSCPGTAGEQQEKTRPIRPGLYSAVHSVYSTGIPMTVTPLKGLLRISWFSCAAATAFSIASALTPFFCR